MENSSASKLVVVNTGWVYIGKVLSQLFSIIAVILVIRKIPVEIYGNFNFLLTGIVIFNIIAASPVVNVFNRFLPEIIENKEYSKLSKIIWVGFIVSSVAAALLFVPLYVFKDSFASFFNIPNFNESIYHFSVFVIARFMQLVMTSVLTSLLLHKYSSLVTVVISLIRSVLYVVYIDNITVNFLINVESITSFLYFALALVFLVKYKNGLKHPATAPVKSPVTKKRVVKFGMYSSFNELGAGIVGQTSDFYIISAMSNLHSVGLYSFAYKLFDLIYKILPIKEFATVIRPIFFRKFSGQYHPGDLSDFYNFIVKTMLPVFGLPFIYFASLGMPIIEFVFDPKYMAAYAITVIILFSNIVEAVFYPTGLVMHLKERMDIALYSKSVVVFSIFGGIWAMKNFGITGVALATVTGELIKNVFIFAMLKKPAKDQIPAKYLAQLFFVVFNHFGYLLLSSALY
ncbi:MAG: oligosaccharide flippase family protein [Bacteroidales bacterium]|nr:oligosaccharide flippase family protein [Bacteroidales bacterium]